MKHSVVSLVPMIALVFLLSTPTSADPLSSAFTYQGRLTLSGSPANGTFPMRFALFGVDTGGSAIGIGIQNNAVVVTDGLFTVQLSFGVTAFDGDARWLEISVSPDNGANYDTLAPRQPLTVTPYALQTRGMYVDNAQNVDLTGTVFVNPLTKFVGINRDTRVTTSEFFGITAPVSGHSFGGMYITTPDADGMPFYGYATGNTGEAYHYFDGGDARWKLVVGSQRMTVEQSTGFVGVGTGAPENTLHVSKGSAGTVTAHANAPLVVEDNANTYVNILTPAANERGILFGEPGAIASGGIIYNNASTPHGIQFRTHDNTTRMVIDDDGEIGIGTNAPSKRLDIRHTGTQDAFYANNLGTGRAGTFQTINSGSNNSALHVASTSNNAPALFVQNIGAGGGLEVVGEAKVGILEVTGADVAEKFPVTEDVEPGMVVAIDAKNPGKLCKSRGAYNRCVAGIVSGANDLKPGAVLGNLPGHEDAPAIALSGRVWVKCDAKERAIEPGDLLTTADRPGYAMSVSDHTRSTGAIIGKAMTDLAKGKDGLVLVLVNLQ